MSSRIVRVMLAVEEGPGEEMRLSPIARVVVEAGPVELSWLTAFVTGLHDAVSLRPAQPLLVGI